MKLSVKLLIYGLAALLQGFCVDAEACTSFIVSGKATTDGRPLILKNRDTGELSNMALLVKGEKYRYVGIVNAGDLKPYEVWAGHNEAGFGIMNTAAYNLNPKDQKLELEGVVMRRALGLCRTLKDFETMLDTMSHPRCVDANFGVLDAEGGCAYYEVGDDKYVKYDANDPAVAPNGYILRTNHGFSGDRSRDQGVERYLAARMLFKQKEGAKFSAVDLLTSVPRYLTHGLTKVNLWEQMPETKNDEKFVMFRDFIPRYITGSCLMVQGVKKGEKKSRAVSWAMTGFPLTTVAIPLVVADDVKLPAVVLPDAAGKSELCSKALELKNVVFSRRSGNYDEYIDLAKLINKEGTGAMQQVVSAEKEIIRRGEDVLDKWRKRGNSRRLNEYYEWVDRYVRSSYTKILNSFK